MDRDEFDELTQCVLCHAEIEPANDRAFAYASDAYLCWGCSLHRGGVYDSDDDRWTEPPNMAGLDDQPRANSLLA